VNKKNIGAMLLIAGLLLIVSPYIKLQSWAYVVYEDYEDTLSGWIEKTTAGYGTLSLSTEQAKEGSQSLKAMVSYYSGWTQARLNRELSAQYQELYMMSWFYIQEYTCSYPAWGTVLLSLKGDIVISEIYLDGSGKIGVHCYDVDSYKKVMSEVTFPIGSWHCLELYAKIGETDGETRVFFDGTEIASLYQNSLNNTRATSIFRLSVGLIDAYKATITVFADKTVASTTYIEPTIEPPATYTLQVNSQPITNIEYTIDGETARTGQAITVDEGVHTIEMPSSISSGGTDYTFQQWDDGMTNPVKTITVSSDVTLTVTYTETTPPAPGEGTLEVHAYVGNNEVIAEVEVNGTQYQTDVNGLFINILPGTYVVTATYQDQTQTQTAIVLEGKTTRLDFTFQNVTTTPPPQEPPTEPPVIPPTQSPSFFGLYMIQMLGIGLIAIGAIVMLGGKKIEI